MKLKLLTILSAVALLASSAFGATNYIGGLTAVNVFGVGTTNPNVALSYAIVPGRSANGGAPVVTYVAATSDKPSTFLQFYKVDGALSTILATNTSARIYVENTNQSNNNWQSGPIVIWHKIDNSYERRFLTANDGATNLILTVATMGAMSVGDMVYHCSSNNTPKIAWNTTTYTNNAIGPGSAVIGGQKGLPMLIEMDCTTIGGVWAVGGNYQN